MKLAFKQQILVLLCVSYCIFSINYVYSNYSMLYKNTTMRTIMMLN
jgi:hypothetical protein